MANMWIYDEDNDKWLKVSTTNPVPVSIGDADVNVDIDMATEGLATSTNQTNGEQKTQLVDDEGNNIEPVTSVGITPPTAITDGNKTVTTAGTAVKLLASTTACQYVTVTALLANTGLISVGGSTTTPSGTVRGDVLAAGDSTVVLVDDVSKIYINSTVNSEGVSFRYG